MEDSLFGNDVCHRGHPSSWASSQNFDQEISIQCSMKSIPSLRFPPMLDNESLNIQFRSFAFSDLPTIQTKIPLELENVIQSEPFTTNQDANDSGKEEQSSSKDTLKETEYQVSLLNHKTKSDSFSLKRNSTIALIQIPLNLEPLKKQYMFLDCIIDLDYIKSMANNTESDYISENQFTQPFKGIQMIEKIDHRFDNKYIQTQIENSGHYCSDITPIIQLIQSLGNSKLKQYSDALQIYWNNNVQVYKQRILQDKQSLSMKVHQESRKKAGLNKFQEITKSLPQDELVCYFFLEINFEKLQFDVVSAGFSPLMYSLIGGSAYEFIDYLMKNGHYDPFGIEFRLSQSINSSLDYFKFQFLKTNQRFKQLKINLTTLDHFTFPATIVSERINLNEEYDIENSLNLLTYDHLCISKFYIEDIKSVMSQLNKLRFVKEGKIKTLKTGEEINEKNFDFIQTEFFDKYYGDQIENLLRKGNKWYKRCGYMDIPEKKFKKQ